MGTLGLRALILCCGLLAPSILRASVLTGSVVGEGGRPIAGAVIEVVGDDAEPLCATTSAASGMFSFPCAAIGRVRVRASFGELRPWEIDDVDLEEGREIHLNFMLLPVTSAAAGAAVDAPSDATGFWSRRLPNPIVTTWKGHLLTLRAVAIGVAVTCFVLGALTMVALGRHFGRATRRLSGREVGDMIMNPHMPAAGERVTPVAVAGARGRSASVSYGADEIATALAAGRYGLVFTALIVAPGLFALFCVGLAVAMLVGHELYLFCAMLLVPAGFVLTALTIAAQALARLRQRSRATPPGV